MFNIPKHALTNVVRAIRGHLFDKTQLGPVIQLELLVKRIENSVLSSFGVHRTHCRYRLNADENVICRPTPEKYGRNLDTNELCGVIAGTLLVGLRKSLECSSGSKIRDLHKYGCCCHRSLRCRRGEQPKSTPV